MKVSVIIAVYKDIQALELILRSLSIQTYENFEVVIAEDGNFLKMYHYVKKARLIYSFDILHTTQEDSGVRKSKSQNNAIHASKGMYLVFIDGDCLVYSNFIQNHVLLSDENSIVTGRRVNVGPRYSTMLREQKISLHWLERNFVIKYLDIKDDAKEERHTEEGFTIAVNGFIHKLMKKLRKKEFPLLGCNMSFYKKAIVDINGFDEGLGNSAMASDTDLMWRFKGLGYCIVSGRYMVNEFHLYHQRSSSDYDRALDIKMIQNQKKNLYRCINGLN